MPQRFGELAVDAKRRVEIGKRILKHHRHAPMAAELTYRFRRHRQHVIAAETNRTRQLRDLHIRQQPRHRPSQGALARAGFADDADALTGMDVEIDAIHRLHGAALDTKVYLHVARAQQGRSARSRVHDPANLNPRASAQWPRRAD